MTRRVSTQPYQFLTCFFDSAFESDLKRAFGAFPERENNADPGGRDRHEQSR